MSNINKINLECIFCEKKADYEFSCQHNLCEKCYKVANFCMICNTKDIKIRDIKINILLDLEKRQRFYGGGLTQLVAYGAQDVATDE